MNPYDFDKHLLRQSKISPCLLGKGLCCYCTETNLSLAEFFTQNEILVIDCNNSNQSIFNLRNFYKYIQCKYRTCYDRFACFVSLFVTCLLYTQRVRAKQIFYASVTFVLSMWRVFLKYYLHVIYVDNFTYYFDIYVCPKSSNLLGAFESSGSITYFCMLYFIHVT